MYAINLSEIQDCSIQCRQASLVAVDGNYYKADAAPDVSSLTAVFWGLDISYINHCSGCAC